MNDCPDCLKLRAELLARTKERNVLYSHWAEASGAYEDTLMRLSRLRLAQSITPVDTDYPVNKVSPAPQETIREGIERTVAHDQAASTDRSILDALRLLRSMIRSGVPSSPESEQVIADAISKAYSRGL